MMETKGNDLSPTPEMDELCRLTNEFDKASEDLVSALASVYEAVAKAQACRVELNFKHIQRLAKIEGVADTLSACEIMAAITEFAAATADADNVDGKVAVAAHGVETAMSTALGLADRFYGATSRASEEAVTAAGEAQAALIRLQARHQEHAINSKFVRQRVWALTSGHCIYCNVPLALEIEEHEDYLRLFHVDHIVPKSCGGPDHISNYVPACASCNTAKRDLPVADFITLKHMKSGKLVLMKVLPQTGSPSDEDFKFAVRQLQKHGPAIMADEDTQPDALASTVVEGLLA